MAISTYDDLKRAIQEWMDRSDIEAKTEDIIRLGEAGLNRKLEPFETDAILTGMAGSRVIDITSLAVREPISLFIQYQAQEYELMKKTDGSFPYTINQQEPKMWTVTVDDTTFMADEIQFDCLLDGAYTFRFHYTAEFALSDDNPTNWLLTKHPDLYLSACIAWGAKFVVDVDRLQMYENQAQQYIAEINWQASKRNKGQLSVDPALAVIKRRYGFYRW